MSKVWYQLLWVGLALSCQVGCSCERPPPIDCHEACTDAGQRDAGETDSGALDAGASDAGELDAGASDAGELDAGASDSGVEDAGVTDAGQTDASFPDSGSGDAGEKSDGGVGDTTSPSVTSILPSQGAMEVDVHSVITANFSEPIAADSLTVGTFQLRKGTSSVAGNLSRASASASFIPSRRLALQGTYVALVTTGVRDLAGNPLASNHSWNFTVRDGRWRDTSLPVQVNDSTDASDLRLAMDSDGRATAVWTRLSGTRSDVWTSRYIPGFRWSTAQLLEADDEGDASLPQVAADANGAVIAVWSQFNGTQTVIRSRRYEPALGWGAIQQLDANTDSAGHAHMAMSPQGHAVVVWTQFDGSWDNTWSNQFIPGSGWEGARQLGFGREGNAYEPYVALDAQGAAIAIWSQFDGTQESIWAARYVPGTGWEQAQRIPAPGTGDAFAGQIVARQGTFLAIWIQADGSRNALWSSEYIGGRGWSTARVIDAANRDSSTQPRIGIGEDGQAFAVWAQYTGRRSDIWYNRYEPEQGWSSARLIEGDDLGDAVRPQVAFDSGGNAIALWQKWDGNRFTIRANRYLVGSGWGLELPIDMSNAGDATWPTLAVAPDGRGISLWRHSQGRQLNIAANHFE